METLHDTVFSTVENNVNNCALIWNDGANIMSATYGDLAQACETVSNCLHEMSVDNGLVGLAMEQCLSLPAIILAILRRRLAFICFDPVISSEQNDSQLKYLNISWVFINKHRPSEKTGILMKNGAVKKELSVLSDTIQLWYVNFSCAPSREQVGSKTIAYKIQTSGTTGIPKIVSVPHKCILPNIHHLRDILQVKSDDVIYQCAPVTFDPSIVDMFLALTSGAALLLVPSSVKASPELLLNVLFPQGTQAYSGVTILQATPSIVLQWSLHHLRTIVLRKGTTLKSLLLGGEPCPSLPILRQWKGIGNETKIYNVYGITEVSCWASIYNIPMQMMEPSQKYIDRPLNTTHSAECQDVPLGTALSNTLLEIRNKSGHKVIHGQGEMFIGSSDRVCIIDNENATDLILPVFRATGDIVQIDSYTGHIFYVGRKDNVIKRYGHRVHLASIEKIVSAFDFVHRCHCLWNSVKFLLGLVVKCKTADVQMEILKNSLVKHLPKSAYPDTIVIVDSLPITSHGKVDKLKLGQKLWGALKDMERNIFSASASPVSVLTTAWTQLLGLIPKPDDTFPQSGGHSILALQLSNLLQKSLGSSPSNFISLLLSGASFKECCACLECYKQPPKDGTPYEPNIASSHVFQPLSSVVEIMKHAHSTNEIKQSQMTLSLKRKHEESIQDDAEYKEKCMTEQLHITAEADTLQNAYCRGRMLLHKKPAETAMLLRSAKVSLQFNWKFDMGKCIDSSPCYLRYSNKKCKVIAGSHSHKLVVLDGSTGNLESECNLPNRVESSACSSPCGKYGIVGCYDGCIYCINLNQGTIHWSFSTGGIVKSSPALCLENSAIVVGSYDHYLYCIKIENGVLQWHIAPGQGSIFASPCVSEAGFIYTATLDGTCAAVSEKNASVTWCSKLQSPIFSSPSLLQDSSAVIFAEVSGVIHCFSAENGTKLWMYKAGGNIFSSFSCQTYAQFGKIHELIVFGCHDKHLYCLVWSQQNEKVSLLWKVTQDSAIFATPFTFSLKSFSNLQYFVHDSVLNTDNDTTLLTAVATTKGTLLLVDSLTGLMQCTYSLPHEVFSSPVVCDGKFIVGCRDNCLYSLEVLT